MSLGGNGTSPSVQDKMMVGWFSNPATWSILSDPEFIEFNTWTHFVGTASGTAAQLFRNGVLVASGTLGTHVTTTVDTDLRIGRRWDASAPTFFPGEIAEVAFWQSIVLSQEEIIGLYNGVSPHRTRPLSLAAYWPLSFSGGTVEKDIGRSSRDMTITGNPPSTPQLFVPKVFNLNLKYFVRTPPVLSTLSATGTGTASLYAAYHEYTIDTMAVGSASLKRDAATTLSITGVAAPSFVKTRFSTLAATGASVATALHSPARILTATGTGVASFIKQRFKRLTAIGTAIASYLQLRRGARPFAVATASNNWEVEIAEGWTSTVSNNYTTTVLPD